MRRTIDPQGVVVWSGLQLHRPRTVGNLISTVESGLPEAFPLSALLKWKNYPYSIATSGYELSYPYDRVEAICVY